MSEGKRQINVLQAGRALAALSVVFHHATLAIHSYSGRFTGDSFFESGYLGVDFFFVLSGFIIYHSIPGKTVGEYAAHRVRRVYLPYLPVGLGMALLYTFVPQFSAVQRDWSWFTSLTLFPLQADTALSVAWTLKHEMLFYAVFALLYFTRTLLSGLTLWTVAIVAFASMGWNGGIPFALINLEFIMGIALCAAVKRGWGHWSLAVAAVLPFGAWLALGADRAYSVMVGASLALVLPPIIRAEREGKIHVPSWLLFLGAASYAIYLVHGVAVSVTIRALHTAPILAQVLGLVASGSIAGIGYYYWVERRIMHAAKTLGRLRRGSQREEIAGVAL